MKKELKHIFQPTGDSCGPTCIKMVLDSLMDNTIEIEEICTYCNTDPIVGTPPDRMILGLDTLGLKYEIKSKSETPFEDLTYSLDSGHYCILRTIMHGVPHWILIYGHEHDSFKCMDPWMGEVIYDSGYLNTIWSIRDYFYFEI